MPPSLLFKYGTAERLDVIEGRRIAYTSPKDFNDPFESQPFLEVLAAAPEVEQHIAGVFPSILEDEIAKLPPEMRAQLDTPAGRAAIASAGPSVEKFVQSMLPSVMDGIRPAFVEGVNKLALLCLTEDPSDLLMWAHYGEEHRGICIGFDASHEHFNQRRGKADAMRFLRRVEYRPARPRVAVTDLSAEELYLVKGAGWAHEKEWRIAKAVADADAHLQLPSRDVHLFEFDPSAMRQVVLGARSLPQTRATASQLLQRQGWEHIELFQAHLHESEYRLVLEKVV